MNSVKNKVYIGKFAEVRCIFSFVGGVPFESLDDLETPSRESLDGGAVVLLALDLGIFEMTAFYRAGIIIKNMEYFAINFLQKMTNRIHHRNLGFQHHLIVLGKLDVLPSNYSMVQDPSMSQSQHQTHYQNFFLKLV